jgi:hypothetical protein
MRATFVAALFLSALPLAACTDHHTGVKSTVQTTKVTGTAADPQPVADAQVTLVDWSGTRRTTTTDANGRYSVETAGLTPPFLVEVDGGDGHQHHTVAFAPGVANATLLSDFVVQALCVAQDVPISDWMADPSGSDPPSECAVDLLVSQLDHALGCWIQMHELDPTTLDFLREPLTAHAAGLGALLDHVSVGEGGLQVEDDTTVQWTNFIGGPPSLSKIETTIESPAGTATFVHQTLIPAKATSAMHEAIVGANTLLSAVAAKVNTRGAALTAGDLLPFFASDCLEDGNDAGLLCAQLATFLRGAHVDSMKVIRTYDFDDVKLVLDAKFAVKVHGNGLLQYDTVRTRFVQTEPGAPTLYLGNGRIANLNVIFETVQRRDVGWSGLFQQVTAEVFAPEGAIEEVELYSNDFGRLFDDVWLWSDGTNTTTLHPTPSTSYQWIRDEFSEYTRPDPYATAGVGFWFTLYPFDGDSAEYEVVSEAAGGEAIAMTAPTSHALADANLGSTLTVTWQPMHTMAVTQVELFGIVENLDGVVETVDSVESLGPMATTGHLQLPLHLQDGSDVVYAEITLALSGLDGERSVVNHSFEEAPIQMTKAAPRAHGVWGLR